MSQTSIREEPAFQLGISSLSTAQQQIATLLEELQAALGTSLDRWENNPQSAYVAVQRSWESSGSKQREIVERLRTQH